MKGRSWGALWRTEAIQGLPLASVGLLGLLWSRATDRGSSELLHADVAAVLGANSRRRAKLIRPLVEAGLLEETTYGYSATYWPDACQLVASCVPAACHPPEKKRRVRSNGTDPAPARTPARVSSPLLVSGVSSTDQRSERSGRRGGAGGELTLAGWMRTRFVSEWEARFGATPGMGGRQLADFPRAVERAAELQGIKASQLFNRCLLAYLESDLESEGAIVKRAPYACFAARFGELAAIKPDSRPPAERQISVQSAIPLDLPGKPRV